VKFTTLDEKTKQESANPKTQAAHALFLAKRNFLLVDGLW